MIYVKRYFPWKLFTQYDLNAEFRLKKVIIEQYSAKTLHKKYFTWKQRNIFYFGYTIYCDAVFYENNGKF